MVLQAVEEQAFLCSAGWVSAGWRGTQGLSQADARGGVLLSQADARGGVLLSSMHPLAQAAQSQGPWGPQGNRKGQRRSVSHQRPPLSAGGSQHPGN